MPARKYPWHLIKVDFLSGLTPKQIEAKYAVKASLISSHAYRNKWQIVAENAQKDVAMACVERALGPTERFIKLATDQVIQRFSDVSRHSTPKDPHEMNAFFGGLQKLNDIGRKTFGLDEQRSQGNTININLLGSFQEAPPTPVAETLDIIEVQPTSEVVNKQVDTNARSDQQLDVPGNQGDAKGSD